MSPDAILVCPGPSARSYRREDWAGVPVCAVNRASEYLDEHGWPYEWYCAMDGISLQRFNPSPTVGIIQSPKMLAQFRDKWPRYRDDLTVYDPESARWSEWTGYLGWSATTAVACLLRMGFYNLLAFGMDWTTADFDGTEPGMRHDQRWNHERAIINQVLRWYPQASIRRIRP